MIRSIIDLIYKKEEIYFNKIEELFKDTFEEIFIGNYQFYVISGKFTLWLHNINDVILMILNGFYLKMFNEHGFMFQLNNDNNCFNKFTNPSFEKLSGFSEYISIPRILLNFFIESDKNSSHSSYTITDKVEKLIMKYSNDVVDLNISDYGILRKRVIDNQKIIIDEMYKRLY